VEVGPLFRDRRDAGRQLAASLSDLTLERPVVVALPRGGVPVAFEIAERLGAPLDILIVRKLGVPWQPELGMGAIGEDGVRVLNEALVARLGIRAEAVEEETAREVAEAERRARDYRAGRRAQPVAGCDVIVVDDGIATGFTVRAAVEVLRRRDPRRVIVAAPVAPPSSVAALRAVADDVVCLATPEPFAAIGQWYGDFRQTRDEEVRQLLAAAGSPPAAVNGADHTASEVLIRAGDVALPGRLATGRAPRGLVVFAHGSGSSRHSVRNQAVADTLAEAGFATLLFDLLTDEEAADRAHVFDVPLLASRLRAAVAWAQQEPATAGRPLGLFGASTGAAAALWAAADLGGGIRAVVSRGGRPDLAGPRLAEVRSPTLLIVGARDETVLALNRDAERALSCPVRLEIVPAAGHLFEEPGALEHVAALARRWFLDHLPEQG
jgi:putative phosphoribosyl transferase